jgi:hypothetical protein
MMHDEKYDAQNQRNKEWVLGSSLGMLQSAIEASCSTRKFSLGVSFS